MPTPVPMPTTTSSSQRSGAAAAALPHPSLVRIASRKLALRTIAAASAASPAAPSAGGVEERGLAGLAGVGPPHTRVLVLPPEVSMPHGGGPGGDEPVDETPGVARGEPGQRVGRAHAVRVDEEEERTARGTCTHVA